MNDLDKAKSIVGTENSPLVCRISDVNMPFLSMVAFMVKWAIAAIPALLILGFLAVTAASLLVGYTRML